MAAIIQNLKQIEDNIYNVPYDNLSDYLKGVRDIINMINGEERSDSVSCYILTSIEELKNDN